MKINGEGTKINKSNILREVIIKNMKKWQALLLMTIGILGIYIGSPLIWNHHFAIGFLLSVLGSASIGILSGNNIRAK